MKLRKEALSGQTGIPCRRKSVENRAPGPVIHAAGLICEDAVIADGQRQLIMDLRSWHLL